jgi:hypothetical protein
MLSNLSNGTRLYMKSPEGDRLEVITLTHGPQGPLFTVTPNTCRFPERREINLPHLLGFYNLHVAIRQGAPRYLGNPFAIMFLLDGDQADKSLETVETERLGAKEPEAKPEPKPKEEETVPCACCDPDADYDDDYEDYDYEDDGRTDPDSMKDFMSAVAASSMRREEAKSLPPVRPEDAEDSEDDEGVPRTYPRYPNRLHLLPENLRVYVELPGGDRWNGILLRNSLFYTDAREEDNGINEWHLVARYRKRFKVLAGGSSTRGLQAIYVASGVGAKESLARLLLSRTDAELACVGSTPTPVPSALEPPEPGAIGDALARIAAKEQALLAELAELDKVQAAMARVAALEARVAAARAALKDI